MIKLLILTSSFAMGGTEAALNSLLNKLDKEKYEVTVLSITEEGPMLDGVPDWVTLRQLNFSDPKYRIFVSGRKEKTDNMKVLLAKVQKKFWYQIYKESAEHNLFYEKIMEFTEEDPEEYDLMLDFMDTDIFLQPMEQKK